LEFSPVGGVIPEPSTWAMLLMGFGLLGLVGYRKTRSALA
jgi:PEP-CTERM motif